MKIDISIIVPVYNVEKYLEKCINSILNQSFQNFELLLINDGSTDGSKEICEFYANKDCRIRVIHKENGGQSSARNVGLDIAKGDYIGFIDSDDYIKEDMYELLYNEITITNSDMAICGVIRVVENIEKPWLKSLERTEFTAAEALYHTLKGEYLNISPCNKLYKRSIFDSLRFKENMIFEDFYITPMMFNKCNKVIYIPNNEYYYVSRSDSTMNISAINPSEDIILVTNEVIDYIRTNFSEVYDESLWPCLRRVWKWIGIIYYSNNEPDCTQFLMQARILLRKYINFLVFNKNMNLQEKIGVISFCYMNFFCKLLYKFKK